MAAPLPRIKQLITICADQGSKLVGFFSGAEQGLWRLRLSSKDLESLADIATIQFNYALDETLYQGSAKIDHIDHDASMLLIAQHEEYDSRPIRKHQRVDTSLEAGIILPGKTDEETGSYIYRMKNRVLNLSLGGAQLACSETLPEDVEKIMVLLSLSDKQPLDKSEQICCHGKVVRVAEEAFDRNFPFIYGIQFRPIAPEYERILEEYINSKIKAEEQTAEAG
jgi:hypothetical protein